MRPYFFGHFYVYSMFNLYGSKVDNISEINREDITLQKSHFRHTAAGEVLRANINQTMSSRSSMSCSSQCTKLAKEECGGCVGYRFIKEERLCEIYGQADYDNTMPAGFALLRRLIL